MQRRHKHGGPSLKVIQKRAYSPLGYTGNQDRPGWRYHPTKGWRKA